MNMKVAWVFIPKNLMAPMWLELEAEENHFLIPGVKTTNKL
jgi:hypothetical protein